MNIKSVGEHYKKELGSEYFAWQSGVGSIGSQLNRWKFQDYMSSNTVVVDFGCGGGDLLACLPARRRIGVEPNADARNAAAAKGIEVYEIAADLPEGVADVVISNHALEHTLYPLNELQALRKTLKQDGKLVIWVPLDDWHKFPDSKRAAFSRDVNHHMHTWTPLNLFNLLKEAGFAPLRVRVVSHAWPKGVRLLYQWMPEVMFNLLARVTGTVTRRYQVMAVAKLADRAQ